MPERSFTDSDGTRWQAWDVVPGHHPEWPARALQHLPDALVEGWLCFESDSGKRRLYPIPRGWEHWSDEELRIRCRTAEPVQWRGPVVEVRAAT